MNKTFTKWLTTSFLLLYSLWVVLFYQLLFTAWTLQYSYIGVLAVIVASLLFYFIFPKNDRRFVFRFTLFSLMTFFALDGLVNYTLTWRIIDWIIFVVLALILGRIFMRQNVLQLFLVIVVLTGFEIWLPSDSLSTLSHFSVDYLGHLASQDPQVPSLPVTTIPDPNRFGQQMILTLQAHKPFKDEAQTLVNSVALSGSNQIENALVEIQHSYDLVTIKPGRLRYHTGFATPQELSQVPVNTLGTADFPFSTSHFLNINGDSRMYLSLSASPGEWLDMLLSPGHMSSDLANISVQTEKEEANGWHQLTGRNPLDQKQGFTLNNGILLGEYDHQAVHVKTGGMVILGVYHLLPKSVLNSPTVLVEGNNLIQVVSLPPNKPKVIATLYGSYSHPLTSDIVFADVLGNGTEQLLINTVPAQIVQLTSTDKWKVLWYSGRDSFRFESVFPQSNGDIMIANSPSLVSNSPIRYLGGYVYKKHQLIQQFRVYHGNLVNLQTVYVSAGSQPQLLMSVYDHQEIMLLGKERIPLYDLVISGYVLGIIIALLRRRRRRSAG